MSTHTAHGEYLLAQSFTDRICQQWSHPLLAVLSEESQVSAVEAGKALAASAERAGKKEYCHLGKLTEN